jgi:hypothetical protein
MRQMMVAKRRSGSWLCKNEETCDGDRMNILRNRIRVRKDSPAHLVSLDWRKTILVASQYFSFSHSLGQKRPICCGRAMSALPPIVLQNSKMRVRENFAIFPSKWIFGNTMPCNELTKEAGWKSDCLSAPYMVFERTHQRPWKNLHTPQKRVLQHNRGKSRHRTGAAKTT